MQKKIWKKIYDQVSDQNYEIYALVQTKAAQKSYILVVAQTFRAYIPQEIIDSAYIKE